MHSYKKYGVLATPAAVAVVVLFYASVLLPKKAETIVVDCAEYPNDKWCTDLKKKLLVDSRDLSGALRSESESHGQFQVLEDRNEMEDSLKLSSADVKETAAAIAVIAKGVGEKEVSEVSQMAPVTVPVMDVASRECKAVSGHSSFEVTLCYSSNRCRGTLVVRRIKCPIPFPPGVAKSEESRRLIHSQGPDSFRVRWESQKEALTVAMQHKGDCAYEGEFHFSFAGSTYFLQGALLYDNFQGTADFPFAKPGYSFARLSTPAQVSCDAPERPYVAPDKLPLCNTLDVHGRWVHSPGIQYLEKGRMSVLAGQWPMKWVPQGVELAKRFGEDTRWEPYSCHYKNYSQDELVNRLANKKFMFMGDSQSRSMFYPTVNSLWQNPILGNPKIPPENGDVGYHVRNNISVKYYLDNFLSETDIGINSRQFCWLRKSVTVKYDFVIIGMGNWAMCGSLANKGIGLWPFERYRKEIDRIGKQLAHLRDVAGVRLIWNLIPPFPFAVDPQRTNSKIRLWNEYSSKVMRAYNIEVFNVEMIADAMLHTAVGYPLGHFNNYHVPETWARTMLSYLVDHPRPPQ